MITEEMLHCAAVRSCEEFSAQLEEGYDLQHPHQFSPEFQARLRSLAQRPAHASWQMLGRCVAAVFFAVLIGCNAWLSADIETRASFIGWTTELHGNMFVYRYKGEAVYEPADYRLGYIPEDYTESLTDRDETGGFARYSNSDGDSLTLLYVISTGEGDALFIDIRDTTQLSITVNGTPGQYFHSESDKVSSCIVWENELGHLICVDGFFERDELLHIAESVEKIN